MKIPATNSTTTSMMLTINEKMIMKRQKNLPKPRRKPIVITLPRVRTGRNKLKSDYTTTEPLWANDEA
jgi:hypothetical protein